MTRVGVGVVVIVAIVMLGASSAVAAPSHTRCYAGVNTSTIEGHETRDASVVTLETIADDNHIREQWWSERDPAGTVRDFQLDPANKRIKTERHGRTVSGTFAGDPAHVTGYHITEGTGDLVIDIDAKLVGDSYVTTVVGKSLGSSRSELVRFDCTQLAAKVTALDVLAPGGRRLCYDAVTEPANHVVVEQIVEPTRFRTRVWGTHGVRTVDRVVDGTSLRSYDGEQGTLRHDSTGWTYKISSTSALKSHTATEGAFSEHAMSETVTLKTSQSVNTVAFTGKAFDCKELPKHREGLPRR